MHEHRPSDDSAERPPDEAWWERELFRREKLPDPDLSALSESPEAPLVTPAEDDPPIQQEAEDDIALMAFTPDFASGEGVDDSIAEDEEGVSRSEGYSETARHATAFAVRLAQVNGRREVPEILWRSAGKIGVNLAGGHGLGYEDETLCGNIVKCRWALADCRFCIEILEQLIEQTRREEYARLLEEARRLDGMIDDRIQRLKQRVWW